MSEQSNGLSGFSLDLYEKCAAKSVGENLIISPFSIATALTLLSQASSGATFEELRNGLRLSGDKGAAANEYLHKYDLLRKGAGNATLSVANQIYVQQGHQIKKTFKDVAVKKFASNIETVNFANKEDTAQTINKFVAEKTNNRIKDLFKPDSIDSDARVILVNAIHFKAEWENKFNEDSTYKKDFYVSETDKIATDFMNREEYANFGALYDLDAKALQLKYANSDFSMIFILPDKRTGLPALEAKLKNYNLTSITGKLNQHKVDISIPKFEVQYEVKLNDILQSMNMGKMFALDADLRGLLESGESLQVSDVVHKAFIKVTEGGSEAAAATGLEVIPLSLILNQPIFNADHPFVYYIWDENSQTPVFIGRLTKFE